MTDDAIGDATRKTLAELEVYLETPLHLVNCWDYYIRKNETGDPYAYVQAMGRLLVLIANMGTRLMQAEQSLPPASLSRQVPSRGRQRSRKASPRRGYPKSDETQASNIGRMSRRDSR
jgi:hypothetical protein